MRYLAALSLWIVGTQCIAPNDYPCPTDPDTCGSLYGNGEIPPVWKCSAETNFNFCIRTCATVDDCNNDAYFPFSYGSSINVCYNRDIAPNGFEQRCEWKDCVMDASLCADYTGTPGLLSCDTSDPNVGPQCVPTTCTTDDDCKTEITNQGENVDPFQLQQAVMMASCNSGSGECELRQCATDEECWALTQNAIAYCDPSDPMAYQYGCIENWSHNKSCDINNDGCPVAYDFKSQISAYVWTYETEECVKNDYDSNTYCAPKQCVNDLECGTEFRCVKSEYGWPTGCIRPCSSTDECVNRGESAMYGGAPDPINCMRAIGEDFNYCQFRDNCAVDPNVCQYNYGGNHQWPGMTSCDTTTDPNMPQCAPTQCALDDDCATAIRTGNEIAGWDESYIEMAASFARCDGNLECYVGDCTSDDECVMMSRNPSAYCDPSSDQTDMGSFGCVFDHDSGGGSCNATDDTCPVYFRMMREMSNLTWSYETLTCQEDDYDDGNRSRWDCRPNRCYDDTECGDGFRCLEYGPPGAKGQCIRPCTTTEECETRGEFLMWRDRNETKATICVQVNDQDFKICKDLDRCLSDPTRRRRLLGDYEEIDENCDRLNELCVEGFCQYTFCDADDAVCIAAFGSLAKCNSNGICVNNECLVDSDCADPFTHCYTGEGVSNEGNRCYADCTHFVDDQAAADTWCSDRFYDTITCKCCAPGDANISYCDIFESEYSSCLIGEPKCEDGTQCDPQRNECIRVTTVEPDETTTDASDTTTTDASDTTTTDASDTTTTDASDTTTTDASDTTTTDASDTTTTDASDTTTTDASDTTTTDTSDTTTTDASAWKVDASTTEEPDASTTEEPDTITTDDSGVSTTDDGDICDIADDSDGEGVCLGIADSSGNCRNRRPATYGQIQQFSGFDCEACVRGKQHRDDPAPICQCEYWLKEEGFGSVSATKQFLKNQVVRYCFTDYGKTPCEFDDIKVEGDACECESLTCGEYTGGADPVAGGSVACTYNIGVALWIGFVFYVMR